MSASNCTVPAIKDLSDLHTTLGAEGLGQVIAAQEVPWQPAVTPGAPAPLPPPLQASPNPAPAQPDFLLHGSTGLAPVQFPDYGLTIRSLDEILAIPADDSDMILGDRVIAKGQSCGLIGASGLGKSRLAMQLACSLACGSDFLTFENHTGPLDVMILQTENSARRVKFELGRMHQHFGCSWDLIREHVCIQTPETDDDYVLNLDDEDNVERVADAVAAKNPDVLILDPLNVFAAGDLNTDKDMRKTCTAIAEIGRRGNVERAVVVLHHALTGRVGAVKATGFDRSSFGRNSKAFHAWARAQINIAPGCADNNDRLVVSCGKNSNGPEFPPFGIRLVSETMTYEVDQGFSLENWQAEVTGKSGAAPALAVASITGFLQHGPLLKKDLVKAIMEETGCAKSKAYSVIKSAEEQHLIDRHEANKTYGPA